MSSIVTEYRNAHQAPPAPRWRRWARRAGSGLAGLGAVLMVAYLGLQVFAAVDWASAPPAHALVRPGADASLAPAARPQADPSVTSSITRLPAEEPLLGRWGWGLVSVIFGLSVGLVTYLILVRIMPARREEAVGTIPRQMHFDQGRRYHGGPIRT